MLVFGNFSHIYKLICSITFNKINFPSLFPHWNVLKSFKKCEGGKGLSNSDYLKRGRRKKNDVTPWEKRGNKEKTGMGEGGWGPGQTRGSGLRVVWCAKISVQVWGEVCVCRPVCICCELGFTLLTSHTFPPVTKCKYIQREMHSHLPCIGLSSLCPVYNLYALYKQLHIYKCIVSLWCADECPLIGKTLFCRNYLYLFCSR